MSRSVFRVFWLVRIPDTSVSEVNMAKPKVFFVTLFSVLPQLPQVSSGTALDWLT